MKTIQERISEILNLQVEFNDLDKVTPQNKQITDILFRIYSTGPLSERLEFAREASAYALGKGMERAILSQIREPNQVRYWVVPLEIREGIKFNLPEHLETLIFDYMDACENAVEDYISENLNVDIKTLFTQIQNIGDLLAKEDKLHEITTAGLPNQKVCTRDEIHNFCIYGAEKALEQLGYKVVQKYLGSANPVNLIVQKDNETVQVCVMSAILPKVGQVEGYRLHQLEQVARDRRNKVALMGVSILPVDELYASMGLIITEGQYQFKVSPLTPLPERK